MNSQVASICNRFRCCDREVRQFIQSGRSAGVGSTPTSEFVSVCRNCGEFKVHVSIGNEHYTVRFHLWSRPSVEAAGKACERDNE